MGVRKHGYLCHGHGARHNADVRTDSGQEANLQAVHRLVEIVDLLVFGGFMVPLVGDGGVGFGIDVGGFKGLRHIEGGCCG